VWSPFASSSGLRTESGATKDQPLASSKRSGVPAVQDPLDFWHSLYLIQQRQSLFHLDQPAIGILQGLAGVVKDALGSPYFALVTQLLQ
jgi:hypothetical protein